jgi:hypothetical protein
MAANTPIELTIPAEISQRARDIAEKTAQPVEQVLLDHLKTLSAPVLEPDEQAELDALRYLSDDALWTIAREQLPEAAQRKAHQLMERNTAGVLSAEEVTELDRLVARADRLMLRKAEASALLREREFQFRPQDFKPLNE